MIRFQCKHCGQKLSISESYAGKSGKCPKCKNIVVVPKFEDGASATNPDEPYDLTLLNVPPKYKANGQQITKDTLDKTSEDDTKLEEKSRIEEEPAGKRKLPWIIDIFLYPISVPGLITLGIIIIIPLLIDVASGLLGLFGFFIGIPGFFFVQIPITLYLFWYLAECIRDSAFGGVRALETLGNAPGLDDMFWHTLKIVACYAVFAGPPFYYFLYTHKTDTIFWCLIGYAVFFFPMGLLAVIMFDSFSALNPILLIGSIFSTFFQYCGLVLIFTACSLIIALTKIQPVTLGNRFLAIIISWGLLYFSFIIAHLLGRFYWRYNKKLNWDV